MIATDYFPVDKPDEVDELWAADQLPRLLAESDIVILTLPLNAQTLGLFDEIMFRNMKRGSYLINVARGSVVVESALVAALKSGHLAGAGLDVTEVEPLAESSELWDDDRVIITPHVGAQSYRRVDDSTNLACLNLKRFLAGKVPYNLVDKHLGFPHPSQAYRGQDS
jgi:D-3-phosphoglycerate dehydrogenase